MFKRRNMHYDNLNARPPETAGRRRRTRNLPKNRDNTVKSGGLVPYALTALLVTVAYIIVALLLQADEAWIRVGMVVCVTFCLSGIVFVRLKKGAAAMETILLLVILIGIVMRIGYMLYTPVSIRSHDIYRGQGCGHADYIQYLFTNGALPPTNEYQYYHPPFAHIVMAIVVKIFSWFQPKATEFSSLIEAAKIVPCFASCAMLFVTRSLCRELKLSQRASLLVLAVVALHPTFYLISSNINNDSLMIFFYLTAVLYTVRWYYDQSWKNILLLAVSIGLGMMTKLSAFTVAFFTGTVFLIVLIQRWKKHTAWPVIGQFAAFGGVSVPLGLWYSVRNYFMFRQMPYYVFQISTGTDLYCGDVSFFERFVAIPLRQMFNPTYCNTCNDVNVWLFTLKSSVFGEYTFTQPDAQARLLVLANFVLILLSLAAMIYVLVRAKEANVFARFGMVFLWLIQLYFFITFNLKYPFGCTMDFRYIVPTALFGAIYLALALDRVKNAQTRFGNVLFYFGVSVILLFGVASVAFYAM